MPDPLDPAADDVIRTPRRAPVPLDDDDLGLPPEQLEARRQPGEVTPLEVIEAELAEEVDLGTVTLEVPGRPRYKVRYRCEVGYEELRDWRDRASATNRAQRRGGPSAVAQAGRLDELKMAAFVLVHKAEAILRDDEDVPDPDGGGPMTFTSPALLDMLSKPGKPVRTATDAVRRFYGVDGHVSAASARVLVEAGWTDAVLAGELEAPADPTPA